MWWRYEKIRKTGHGTIMRRKSEGQDLFEEESEEELQEKGINTLLFDSLSVDGIFNRNLVYLLTRLFPYYQL